MEPSSAPPLGDPLPEDRHPWVEQFLNDLAVVRSANTVRAYRGDLARWIAFCATSGIDPFRVGPRTAIDFIRSERERACGDRTVSPRTIVRRLSAVRQWYAYLALEPERTGVRRNPIPVGAALRTSTGAIAGTPALLRYDRPLPTVLTGEEMDRFIGCLTATRYRDRAIVWLLKDGGLRISEVLGLQLGDITWSQRLLTVRAAKTRTTRMVPVSPTAIAILADYVRLERPKLLAHEAVFVNLGRRGYGQPFTYRSWVAVCQQARLAAATPGVHAHAFRHTYATNMAESGLPLDTLKRLLGHRHLDTLAIYNHVRDHRVQREYEAAMAAQAAQRRPDAVPPTGGLVQ
jgi:site-specific recombinase XerD